MKITFPHMGNIHIPLKALFENLGFEVIIPPHCSKKTLDLGVANSPETACLPLKINIGNFIEALELGADTIVMAGGLGPCRFGYYGQVQKEILKDLGYKFEMIILEPPKGHFLELINKIKFIANKKNNSLKDIIKAIRIAWKKALIIDNLDRLLYKTRAVEATKGETDKLYSRMLQHINDTNDEHQLVEFQTKISQEFSKIKVINKKNIKIGLVGEIYTVLEPFVNLNIAKKLGELGVEVHKDIYITDWVRENLFPSFLKSKKHKAVLELSKPYVNCFIGGHGQESVGQMVNFSKKGFDGVIHLLPLTCMPEIVAKSAIPKVRCQYDIPVMTIVLDEHASETGFVTRLEAFIDMIKHKKEVENCKSTYLELM